MKKKKQGELLKAKAQLKCPKGHVGVSHARRERTDIRSRGDCMFRGIHSGQKTTSSHCLKGEGMWESRKGGWDNIGEPDICC